MAVRKSQSVRSNRSGFLKGADVTACKKLAAGKGAHAGHARALLAVHAGATQAEAARQSGLTPGQVRYWLAKFRQHGMTALETPARPTSDKRKPAKPAKSTGKKKDKKAKKTGKKAAKAAKKAQKKKTKADKKAKKVMKKTSAKKKHKKK